MTIILVRHTAVALVWRRRCYGRSDVPLSRAGKAAIGPLADALRGHRPDRIIHSGLTRTRALAESLGTSDTDPAWQERDFGSWEGQSWTAIYRATGAAMDGMIDTPDGFRPGGGETTTELAQRVMAAYAQLPTTGTTMIITHGGPIAAILGTRAGLHPRDWLPLVPAYGGVVTL
jgi:broad specificity phosphatase PhoE